MRKAYEGRLMKYYVLFFFVFCILVGGGVYTLNSSPIMLSFFSYELALPLSLWILGSVSIFFLISLLFFVAHWIGGFLSNYRQEKDFNHLINQIHDQILQKHPRTGFFYTKTFQTLSKALQRTKLEPYFESSPSQCTQIDELLTNLESLKNGKVTKTPLLKETSFWIQNTQNRIGTDLKFAQKVIEGDYDRSLKQYAAIELIQNETLNEKIIEKIIHQERSNDEAKSILELLLDKGYKLGKVELMKLLGMLDSKSLIDFFRRYKHQFDPDFCIDLFGDLAREKEEAKNAFVYVLIDFSMFDRSKEFLRDHEELILPRAYIDLKESGKNYPLEQFFI